MVRTSVWSLSVAVAVGLIGFALAGNASAQCGGYVSTGYVGSDVQGYAGGTVDTGYVDTGYMAPRRPLLGRRAFAGTRVARMPAVRGGGFAGGGYVTTGCPGAYTTTAHGGCGGHVHHGHHAGHVTDCCPAPRRVFTRRARGCDPCAAPCPTVCCPTVCCDPCAAGRGFRGGRFARGCVGCADGVIEGTIIHETEAYHEAEGDVVAPPSPDDT